MFCRNCGQHLEDNQPSVLTVTQQFASTFRSSLDIDHEDLTIQSNHYNFLPTDDFPTLDSLMEYFAENGDSYRSMRDHGTHCAGIIGANGNNELGTSGVNWKADLHFTTWWYYMQHNDGSLTYYSTWNSMLYNIGYMVASECRVISISVGSTDPSPVSSYELEIAASYDALVQKLEEAGYDFLIMKSAGNSTRDASNYQLNRVMTTGTIQDAVTDNLINDAGVLDSHLVGPTPYGSRFHIYYSDKNYYYNGGSRYSTALANSGAQVKVYVGGTNEYYEFYVPNHAGTVWEVFSFKNGVLTPINYMTYGSASYMPS